MFSYYIVLDEFNFPLLIQVHSVGMIGQHSCTSRIWREQKIYIVRSSQK